MQVTANQIPVLRIADERERPTALSDEAIAWLDAASEPRPLNEDLLSFDGAASVRASIKCVLTIMARLDVGELIARQGWLHRLTGADIEAKLRFELSVKQVNLLLDELRLAATRARSQLENMQREDQARLAGLIDYAAGLREDGTSTDPFIVDRLERRVANMITMSRANDMAVAQFRLAEDGLRCLLDRYGEIAGMVIPLWQQHAFAVIHAPARLSGNDADVANFLVCHSALEEYFDGEARL